MSENNNFSELLNEFNKLVEPQPQLSKIKDQLLVIRSKASSKSLTPRQVDAIYDRVNNYINGQYDTQKHSLKLA
jgi:hypothetical protein